MVMVSDYVGPWKALVNRDVYDVNKEFVMMPQGTELTGQVVRISNVNEAIQSRQGMTIRWAVLPDGSRIDMSRQVMLDQSGIAAIPGDVDYHILAQLLGVAAYAAIAAPSFAISGQGDGFSSQQAALTEATGNARSQGQAIANRYLRLSPTITTPIGTPVNVFIEDDLYVRPWREATPLAFPTAALTR